MGNNLRLPYPFLFEKYIGANKYDTLAYKYFYYIVIYFL